MAYTVGDFKGDQAAIKSGLTALGTKLDSMNTNTDGVEGKLDTLNGKDFATQTTLAALKSTIDALKTTADDLKTAITAIKDTAGIKRIEEAVPCIPVRSTDTKPTMSPTWRGYCFETDTQKLFDWSGSAWVEVV